MSARDYAPVLVGLGVGAAALVGVALIGRYALKKAGEAPALFNPLDRRNLAYEGVNSVGETFSGDKNWTLGGWIFGLTTSETDPTKYTQAELERIWAARNRRANRMLGVPEDWIVG